MAKKETKKQTTKAKKANLSENKNNVKDTSKKEVKEKTSNKKVDTKFEENKNLLISSEKYLFKILIIIAIALIPFISYMKNIAFFIFPFILILEYIGYIYIKSIVSKKDINEFIKKEKTIKYLYNISKYLFYILLISLIGLVFYIIKNLIENNAFSFIFQVLTLNIISFVVFIFLIILIFKFSKLSNETEDVKTNDLLFTNEKENIKLERIIYFVFIVITCIIPFAYAFITNKSLVKTNIWVVGCLSNLIFGILTSIILRNAKYNKISYKILSLVLMFICLIGCVSKVTNFIIAYISFILTILISFILFKFYNKKPKDCSYLMIILLILIILLLPKWM